ncbi:MarR family transcriptional regulator [Alicyclobacillus fastidiosus]|uniref:MarR family transcriptional regulator n=1 Tax=Alicyclobacillus fastidiosus TaxID=392011 RepID=A0ABY6ZMX8_9BACL|nr:MarR family transcriptional regulator [Alicyclobacillus fastidiosus]WAH44199.1 MarR family transcriptional regulator [Alicyclobacillus fastidiosus]GMA60515.1 MarR family transcriptional regulator [Alicyclobacillus fastidiosus]
MNEPENIDQVRKLDNILERLFRAMKARGGIETGLTTTQLFVMRYLSYNDDVKSSDIARIAGLSPGAITQVCDELVRLGYVERTRSKDDRRVVFVALTDEGRANVKDWLARRAIRLSQLLDKMGRKDADALTELLERLVNVVETESIE